MNIGPYVKDSRIRAACLTKQQLEHYEKYGGLCPPNCTDHLKESFWESFSGGMLVVLSQVFLILFGVGALLALMLSLGHGGLDGLKQDLSSITATQLERGLVVIGVLALPYLLRALKRRANHKEMLRKHSQKDCFVPDAGARMLSSLRASLRQRRFNHFGQKQQQRDKHEDWRWYLAPLERRIRASIGVYATARATLEQSGVCDAQEIKQLADMEARLQHLLINVDLFAVTVKTWFARHFETLDDPNNHIKRLRAFELLPTSGAGFSAGGVFEEYAAHAVKMFQEYWAILDREYDACHEPFRTFETELDRISEKHQGVEVIFDAEDVDTLERFMKHRLSLNWGGDFA